MNSSAGLVGGSDPLVIELPVQRDQDNCHSFSTHVTSSSSPLTPSSTKSLELLEKKKRQRDVTIFVFILQWKKVDQAKIGPFLFVYYLILMRILS